jgi:hypothetical protein
MRTSNGLNVPTGWGRQQPADRRPCPMCHLATNVVVTAGGFKALDEHTRRVDGEYGRSHCPGSGRLVDAR